MTKLEQKLQELGYENSKDIKGFYRKETQYCYISIYVNEDNTIKYEWCGVQKNRLSKFQTQDQIENLQEAFNIMQKDLEILKEYENE